MIVEKKKQVLSAIEQVQDEATIEKIAAMVDAILGKFSAGKPISPPGFAAGAGFWMADDFDEPLADFKEYE
ncbi:DUF2281 domain-containing protein [Hymenobacter caeli]|uniref:DUF2281 domain-containing protein n=1 Tax=Hymenobacter caeli TaxID=2735894 RepID=A0ABX2FNV0_9BACT|nr:DUF2281 domain-containing protein [Hymenobacter caeli]NRT18528.1 hypothetical protein [Hymenobacter caeli]